MCLCPSQPLRPLFQWFAHSDCPGLPHWDRDCVPRLHARCCVIARVSVAISPLHTNGGNNHTRFPTVGNHGAASANSLRRAARTKCHSRFPVARTWLVVHPPLPLECTLLSVPIPHHSNHLDSFCVCRSSP